MAHSNLKKNGKTSKKPAAKMPGEWLYLNKEELPLRKIYELFNEAQNAEYWEAAGVLEISLPESGTLDMEDLEGTLGDDEGDAYLLQNGIHTVFAATIRPEDYEKAKEIMLFIKKLGDITLGGYFCCRYSRIFKPVVAAK
ncbi:MAG: hypothetical protein V8S84_13605 [Lachnospiraceae bacterium]